MSKTSDKLAELVAGFAAEDGKFMLNGNASAGKRARKILQEIKNVCQERRKEIQVQKHLADAA